MFAYRGVMSANLGRMKLLSLSILVLTTISFVRCYPVAGLFVAVISHAGTA